MFMPDLFRQRAAECETMVTIAREPDSKAAWSRIAERWHRCAELEIKANLSEARHENPVMKNPTKLPTWADKGRIYAVVETPRGSRAKLSFDPKLHAFTLSKPLLAGLTYPYDWGFVPSTKAPDGDPLDVLIIHDAGTYPGLVLTCMPIGVLEVEQTKDGKKERNDRLFAVPDRSPFEGDLRDIRDLRERAKEELEKFFEATDALEPKTLKFLGWEGPDRALKTIKKLEL